MYVGGILMQTEKDLHKASGEVLWGLRGGYLSR